MWRKTFKNFLFSILIVNINGFNSLPDLQIRQEVEPLNQDNSTYVTLRVPFIPTNEPHLAIHSNVMNTQDKHVKLRHHLSRPVMLKNVLQRTKSPHISSLQHGKSSNVLETHLSTFEPPLALPIKSNNLNITWGRAQVHKASFANPYSINVTAREGDQTRLPCTVLNLGQAEVSWIRQADLHILSAGETIYTSDQRFKVQHDSRNHNWTLFIGPVTVKDAGTYECQVSTRPKISRFVHLIISVERAEILEPPEIYIRNGSTISLTCHVRSKTEKLDSILWKKDGEILDYDSPRGGISLQMEKTPTIAKTELHITKARKSDSGMYFCSPEFAKAAFVTVHVVNGEESAAVQTNGCVHRSLSSFLSVISYSVILYFISSSLTCPFMYHKNISKLFIIVIYVFPITLSVILCKFNLISKFVFHKTIKSKVEGSKEFVSFRHSDFCTLDFNCNS